MKSNKFISYCGMKRILKCYLDGDISEKTIIYCQELLEQYLKELCKRIVIQQEEMNRLREFHGLPKLKRYSVSTNINGVGEVFNPSSVWLIEGEVGKLKKTTLSKYKADEEVA
jgi:hypothetical protein